MPGVKLVTVKSEALRQRVDLTLFCPELICGMIDVPIVILLHGVYGSHWAWTLKGEAHVTCQRLISQKKISLCVLAMPSDGLWGDGSGYLKHPHQDFEKWIVDEVPAVVSEVVPECSENSSRFIAGLSMGGFGALRLGAKYGSLFSGISGHSSITHFDQIDQFVEEGLESYKVSDEDHSVEKTMERSRHKLPPIRFDCGREDSLLPENRKLHQALKNLGIEHDYSEFPGGYEWTYWEEHLQDTLMFFLGCD
ncbi:MAG: alpha/beta hydrolase-fold protein [Verrucomicrobiota bacterium]